jgi:hypothetical protein
MKNIILLISCLIILSSCSGNDDDGPKVIIPVGSIVAKVDGVETHFDTDAYATLDTIPWNFAENAVKLSIMGKKTAGSDSENILIWFFVSPAKKIDTGIYPDLNKQVYQYLEFNNQWNGNLYNYGSNRYIDEFYSSKSTITRIYSIVQGVFSGNVGIGTGAEGNEQPPLYHKIRNGQFNVRIAD